MTEKQVNQWIDFMDKNIDDFLNAKETLLDKFGSEPRTEDVIWRMFNDKILEIAIGDEHNVMNRLKSNYELMASFLIEIENKDPFSLIKQVRELELKKFQAAGIYTKVRIGTMHEGTCSTAKKIKNKIYKLSDAMYDMPIPSPLCKNKLESVNPKIPYCTCYYFPLTEDEKF